MEVELGQLLQKQAEENTKLLKRNAELLEALQWLMKTVDGCLTPAEAEGWQKCKKALGEK